MSKLVLFSDVVISEEETARVVNKVVKLARTMSNLDVDVEDVAFEGVERAHACTTTYVACMLACYQPNFRNDPSHQDMILQTLRFMGSVGLAPAPTEVHDILAPVSVKSYVFF